MRFSDNYNLNTRGSGNRIKERISVVAGEFSFTTDSRRYKITYKKAAVLKLRLMWLNQLNKRKMNIIYRKNFIVKVVEMSEI